MSLADRAIFRSGRFITTCARKGVIREAALGLGRMSLLAGMAALAAVCGHELEACELSQKSKPAARSVQAEQKWSGLAELQKRLADLLRQNHESSQPSRRVILQ